MIKLRLFVVGPDAVWVVDVVVYAVRRPLRALPVHHGYRRTRSSVWAGRGAVESPEVADMAWSRLN